LRVTVLYDLDADIGETNDLAAERPEKVKEFKTLLDRWLGSAIPPDDADRHCRLAARSIGWTSPSGTAP
jgi:hypothetical protein